MPRKYWYVASDEYGWSVQEGEGATALGPAQPFRTRTDAMQRARSQASAMHAASGRPTGVRIRGIDGRWREECSFGSDPLSAPPLVGAVDDLHSRQR